VKRPGVAVPPLVELRPVDQWITEHMMLMARPGLDRLAAAGVSGAEQALRSQVLEPLGRAAAVRVVSFLRGVK
jgi:hypothetical protein